MTLILRYHKSVIIACLLSICAFVHFSALCFLACLVPCLSVCLEFSIRRILLDMDAAFCRWSSCWTYLLGCYRGRYIHFFRLRFNYSFSGQAGDDGSEGTPVFHMDVLRSGRTVIIGPMACLCRGCEGMEKQLYGNYQFSLGDHRQFFGV